MLNNNNNNENQIKLIAKTTKKINQASLSSGYNLSQAISYKKNNNNNSFNNNKTFTNKIDILMSEIESTQFITKNKKNNIVTQSLNFNNNNENDLLKCNCNNATDLLLFNNSNFTTKILNGDFAKDEINLLTQNNCPLILFQSEKAQKITNNSLEKATITQQQHQLEQKNVQIRSTLLKMCDQRQQSFISSEHCLIDQKIICHNHKNISKLKNDIFCTYSDPKSDKNNDIDSNAVLIVDHEAEPIWQLAPRKMLRQCSESAIETFNTIPYILRVHSYEEHSNYDNINLITTNLPFNSEIKQTKNNNNN